MPGALSIIRFPGLRRVAHRSPTISCLRFLVAIGMDHASSITTMAVADREEQGHKPGRRRFLSALSSFGLIASLAAAYGTFASFAARFLYAKPPDSRRWQYVTEVGRLRPGESLNYVAPNGAKVAVARRGTRSDASAFIALSSVCPHLGCQVHWQGSKQHFFCPCHNGAFDAAGRGISGPPGDAGQSLSRYELKVESGLLYINVPMRGLASSRKDRLAQRRV